MSVSTLSYAFGTSNPTEDLFEQKPYPGVILNGTEIPNGGWSDIREVNGNLWLTTNAAWNASILGWQQINPLLPSSALELLPTPALILYGVTSGASLPIVWGTGTDITGGGGTALKGGTAVITSYSALSSSQLLLAANAARVAFYVDNGSGGNMYLAFAATASTATFTQKVPSGQVFTPALASYTGPVSVYCDSPTGLILVTEVTP